MDATKHTPEATKPGFILHLQPETTWKDTLDAIFYHTMCVLAILLCAALSLVLIVLATAFTWYTFGPWFGTLAGLMSFSFVAGCWMTYISKD